jgi:hypothetical protein
VRFSLAVVVLFTFLPAPPGPISLRLSQRECAAPCSLTATVTIPRHPDNRSASVVWGYDTSDSTDWPLRPNASVEFDVDVRNLSKGTHTIYAVLLREKDGQSQTFEDSQKVTVR